MRSRKKKAEHFAPLPCAVVVAATCYGCTAIVATVAVISDIIFHGSMTWSRRRAVAPHSSCGKKTRVPSE